MRKYSYNGELEVLKTKPNEVTVSEFMKILSSKDDKILGNIEYYFNAFKILGLSDELMDEIDIDNLFIIIKDFNEDFKMNEDNDIITEFELDGYIYKSSNDDEFKLNARDLTLIEKKFDDPNWPLYALAIIFKRDDLSKIEHYDNNHIKHKMNLFKNIKMDVAMYYIYYIAETYSKNIKLFVINE